MDIDKYKLVLFDIDGTILENKYFYNFIKHFLKKKRIPVGRILDFSTKRYDVRAIPTSIESPLFRLLPIA